MSGKIWKKLLAAGCAMSLLATAPGMTVLADQIPEDEVIVTDAEDPEQLTDFAEDPGEDVIDEDADELSEEETLSVENDPAEEVDVSPAADEEEDGTGDIIVGDGVTATFDEETGTVEFYSEGGTLSEYWKYELGERVEDIKSIKVASGTVFLPEDSDSIFSIYYEDYSEDNERFMSNLEAFDSSGFDTSNVTSMYEMFKYCNKLTALDLSNFDTSKVRNMEYMFSGCTDLKNIDLGSFDTSYVTGMYYMFKDCESLTNLDLSSFNTSNVTDMDDMFRGCSSLTDLNLSSFDTSNVTDMNGMFYGCSSLTDLNLSSFDTSNVTDMNDMFCGCSSLTDLDLSSFDTSNTEYYHNIFYKCKGLISLRTPQKNSLTINLPVAMYDESGAMYSKLPVLSSSITLTSKGNGEILVGDNVIATYDEETGAVEFYSNDGELWNSWLDDSEIDKKAITSIKVASGTVYLPSDSSGIFSVSDYDDAEDRYVSGLIDLDLSGFDTSNVTDMKGMFTGCSSLKNIDLQNFNTSKVTSMWGLFADCESLNELDLSVFDTTNVTSFYHMFSGCTNLASLDISSFVLDSDSMEIDDEDYYTDCLYMFDGCNNLSSVKTPLSNNVYDIALPVVMCDEEGTLYYSLPVMTGSIELKLPSQTGQEYRYNVGEGATATFDAETGEIVVYSDGGTLWKNWLGQFDKGRIQSIKLAETSSSVYLPANSSNMFRNCNYLSNLDLKGFDTSNVTDMSYLFSNCYNLEELDVSGFNTSKVQQMHCMFLYCDNLNELDLSSFDTANVNDMGYMFYYCYALTDLNLSSFNTRNVRYMKYMFSDCRNLTNLDLSSFVLNDDAPDLSDDPEEFDWDDYENRFEDMFDGCKNLISLKTPMENNAYVELPFTMYDESGNSYYSLPEQTGSILLKKFPSRLVVGDGVTATYDAETRAIEFYSDEGTLWNDWIDKNDMDRDYIESIKVASGTVHLPADCRGEYSEEDEWGDLTYYRGMFCDCRNLKNLDLSGFDTSNVTNMKMMFSGCSNLKNLDLSGFDTSNVTDVSNMFADCSNLTELDLGSFNTSNVTDMSDMFSACYSLTNLDLSNFNTSNVTDMSCMFYGCYNLTELNPGSFSTSNVTDMRSMFNGCSNLTNLDLSNFNTSNVTDMRSMFYDCNSLTNLDLSNFNTSNVTDMAYMFSYCFNLKDLDLSNFNTSNVTDMRSMFYDGRSFTNLDLSRFDTSNVTDMNDMFGDCESLTNLDLRSFDTSNVTDMNYMFYGCSSLADLDLRSFDTSNVTDMNCMFYGCSSLADLDLSNFDTSNVTNMGYMFYDCSSLTNLDLSSFDTSNVVNYDHIFRGCRNLLRLYTPKKNSLTIDLPVIMYDESGAMYRKLPVLSKSMILTSKGELLVGENVTATFDEDTGTVEFYSDGGELWRDWLNISGFDKDAIKSINVASGTVYLPDDSNYIFSVYYYDYDEDKYMSNLEELDLSGFDTSNVTDMTGMFYYCSSLTNLDLSGFDTSNVTDMDYMFYGCSSLADLDLSGFDTSNVRDMCSMFNACSSLTNLDLSNFDTSNVTDMSYMFYGCSSLTDLDLSDFNTANVTDMNRMFYYCNSLTNLNLSGFDTSNLDEYYYYNVFYSCDSLSVLNTPKKNSFIIDLPTIMYDETGNEYTSLPVLSESITLTKDRPGSSIGNISDCTVNLETQSYTYDGKEKKPTVTVNYRTDALLPGTDYSVTYSNNINAGIATVKVEGIGNYQGEQTVTFIIEMADPKLTFESSSVNKTTLDADFTNKLTKTTDGTVTFKSSDTNVATVSSTSGKVTIKGEGTATITATAAEGTNYKSGSAEYTLTVVDGRTDVSGLTVSLSATSYTYDGKAKEPTVTVKNGSTILTAGTDYTVSYSDNTNAGTATAKVAGAGKYKGEKSVTFTISKADAILTFADSALTKKTTDAAFTNTLTKTTDGSVTFKSSNTKVATVNSTSGLVTIKGAGKANITASSTEGKNYNAGSATYSLTVQAPVPTTTPTPTPKPTATPTPKPTVAPASKPTVSGFSDVQDPNHAYYKAIYWAADAGITKGYPDGTFGINRSCTRGEMMMFLWRYAGKPAAKTVSKSPFKDVPKTHTFYNAILWGSQKGITKGYSDGTFGVNRNVSRGECMMFLWRLRGKPAPKAVAKSPFSDVPKTHVFYNAILWGAQKKITTGYTSGAKKGTFGINENCTRGQIVTFLYRAK